MIFIETGGGDAHEANLGASIPVWVCTQCGEPFFEASEVEAIQRALQVVDRESAALVA